MNIPFSHKTLSRYLEGIPEPRKLSDILVQYVCEVEGTEMHGDDTVFDLKITPDRGDMLSYWGLAREISVYSAAKLKNFTPKIIHGGEVAKLIIEVNEPKLCPRYIGCVIEGINDRKSPDWLREALEASGQRSINAVVDVTNFVMLETGQPMHAFDADKLTRDEGGAIKIIVRKPNPKEKISTLDGKDIVLPPNALVIADNSQALAIAGVKGGAHAGVTAGTKNIVLESAVFSPVMVRKSSKAVGISTDSSRRFEHHRSPEITRIAMSRAIELLSEIFPDVRIGNTVDVYPRPANPYKVGISAREVERVLGVHYTSTELERDLGRLHFSYEEVKDIRKKVVDSVMSTVGAPYIRGASVLRDAPRAFDCAALSAWAYVQAGIAIPRITIDQFVFSHKTSLDRLNPGDLVFINTGVTKSTTGEWYSQVLERNVPEVAIRTETLEYMPGTKVPQGIDHVGIYLGDNMICHATSNEGLVLIEKLGEGIFNRDAWYGRIIEHEEERFVITVPPERFDIRIGADVIEEIIKLIGYDEVPSRELINSQFSPAINHIYDTALRVRSALVELGFSEIFTYVFRHEGQVEIANPIAEGISFLRDNLSAGMKEALVFNARNAPLLGVDELLMFEIGTAFFSAEKEAVHISLGATVTKSMKQAKKESRENEILNLADRALENALGAKISWHKDGNVWERVMPEHVAKQNTYAKLIDPPISLPYRAISAYPFMLRDIALWSNNKLSQEEIIQIIRTEAVPLLVHDRLFDIFTKDFDGVLKTSYAYNLVFQSYERTLSDVEISEIMTRITIALVSKGLEVR